MHYHIRRCRGDTFLKYAGLPDELLLDLDAMKLRIAPFHEFLQGEELYNLYAESHGVWIADNRMFIRKPSYIPGTFFYSFPNTSLKVLRANAGQSGEIFFCTDDKVLYAMNGETLGGFAL